MQEEVTVEALLDSGATGLVMSLEFTKKQRFKLKRLERPICYESRPLGLNNEVILYRVYTRELDGELCTG